MLEIATLLIACISIIYTIVKDHDKKRSEVLGKIVMVVVFIIIIYCGILVVKILVIHPENNDETAPAPSIPIITATPTMTGGSDSLQPKDSPSVEQTATTPPIPEYSKETIDDINKTIKYFNYIPMYYYKNLRDTNKIRIQLYDEKNSDEYEFAKISFIEFSYIKCLNKKYSAYVSFSLDNSVVLDENEYKDTDPFFIRILNRKTNQPYSNEYVYIIIDGKPYEYITNDDGVVCVNIQHFKDKEYKYVAAFKVFFDNKIDIGLSPNGEAVFSIGQSEDIVKTVYID
ncbi:MAG: hypothetical protein PHY64_00825 [Eubacteriales bacterium]|nr:hypothetical protein [Eubacteriales bacterium]